MKISYLANIRLPTERAHGLQIVKMCSFFAERGSEVALYVPQKVNKTIKESVFDYYAVKQNFNLIRLNSSDFLGMTLWFGKLFYWADLFSFVTSIFFAKKIEKGSVIYTRDILTLVPFSSKNYRLCLEVHNIPARYKFFINKIKGLHAVVAITQGLKDDLVKLGVPSQKILVAHDAVTTEDFNIKETKEEVRQKLGLPSDKKIVLYTGHLYEWKGAHTLASAASRFDTDTLFVFVGGVDTELQDFKNKFGSQQNIRIEGFKPHQQMPLYMRAADVCVLPNSGKTDLSSRYTSPLKLFEYMASGTPIVASSLPSIKEVLSDRNAMLVSADDVSALASGIHEVLKDGGVAKSLAEQALTDVKEYTWSSRAGKILDFIKK